MEKTKIISDIDKIDLKSNKDYFYYFKLDYRLFLRLLSEGFKYVYIDDLDNFIFTKVRPVISDFDGILFIGYGYISPSLFLNKYMLFGEIYLLEDFIIDINELYEGVLL